MPANTATSDTKTPGAARLHAIGGEFRDSRIEIAFENARAAETIRHSRDLLGAGVVLNILFLFSDWRFLGTPHFWIAVPARLLVIAIAAGCLTAALRMTRRRTLQRLMTAWMLLTAGPVGVLCSSQSEIALLVVVTLPSIYYLCVPVPFRWLLGCCLVTSLTLLAGFAFPGVVPQTGLGLLLVMVMLNTALVLSVTRSNRLARTTWLSARTERRLRRALDRSGQALERMFAACPVPLLLADRADGSLLRMSDSCVALIGGGDPATLLQLYPTHRDTAGAAEFETPLRVAGGEERTLLVKAAALEIDGRGVVLAGLVDITQRKAEHSSLERLAATDALTGLRNRLSFFAAARAEMLRAVRGRTPLALLMVDMDHFKQINDTHGHQGGDAALRAFARLCGDLLGRRAVIGRLGGEEFGVLVPGAPVEQAAQVAEDLRAAAAALAIEHGGATIRLTVSIGVAGIRTDDRDIDGALGRADMALYAAKRDGRNRVMLDGAAGTGRRTA